MTAVVRPGDEHTWHDCPTPGPPNGHEHAQWACPVCHQEWIWRRPPRPIAQWIRADHEEANRT